MNYQAYLKPILFSCGVSQEKDNICHFCVDHKAHNEKTVKDKYPIPLIEELLDELNGVDYFSMLDLQLSYH